MHRREFTKLIDGTAAFWPLRVRAQQAPPTIGFLSPRSPEESSHLVAAFRKGLAETGAVEGRNLAAEYRWALGDYDRLPSLAKELASRPVTLIVAVEASLRRWRPRPRLPLSLWLRSSPPIRSNAVSSPA